VNFSLSIGLLRFRLDSSIISLKLDTSTHSEQFIRQEQ
jgi:hypothetical protein